jgi:hypothetical protein
LRRKAWIVQKRRIWKNRLVALIILKKSTFPDIRDSAPKVWFGRAACAKPQKRSYKSALGRQNFFGGSASLFV